jgi:O-antigen biosynthesis protein WbqV
MGQPVKIVDLAERLIRLSGLQPGHDVEIVFTGIRPGERLHEILFASQEPAVEIGLDGIMAAKPLELPMSTVRKSLAHLHQAVIEGDEAKIRSILKAVVSDFR